MTFDSLEVSRYSSKPVECYRFTYGANDFLFAANDAPTSIDVGGTLKDFEPAPIESTAADHSQEDVAGEITVTLPRVNAANAQPTDGLVALFVGGSLPITPVGLTCYRRHEDDDSQVIFFSGRVASCVFEAGTVKLRCVPFAALLQRTVPPLKCSRLCNWVTYSPECGVDKASFTDSGTVSGIAGLVVRAAVFAGRADGWFTNGWIELADGTRGAIRSHAGEYVTLLAPMPGLSVGVAISAVAGDDFTEPTCRNKFSNTVNFSGTPRQPDRNPYELGTA